MKKLHEIRTLQRNMHNPASRIHTRDLVTDTILPVLWDHLLLGTGGFWSTEWSGPEMTLMVSQTELLSVSMPI